MDQIEVADRKIAVAGLASSPQPDQYPTAPRRPSDAPPGALGGTPPEWRQKSLRLRLLRRLAVWVNARHPWHGQGKYAGYLNLALQRYVLQHHNLYDSGLPPAGQLKAPSPNAHGGRAVDGAYNDLAEPTMGMAAARFGRNMPLARACPHAQGSRGTQTSGQPSARADSASLLKPDPREIADRLLTRHRFIEAKTINLLAVGWIQFMVHDWFVHPLSDDRIELPSRNGKPMRVRRSATDPTAAVAGSPMHCNREAHWWDGSQIYGSSADVQRRLRSGSGGKLWINTDRLLPLNEKGLENSGVIDNWWTGLTVFHTLFTLEHNAICDELAKKRSGWSDDQLFNCARLINTALMAKIHILEWTPTVGCHPTLELGVNVNWWGLLGQRFVKKFGRPGGFELLTGIPGSSTNHHGIPYAMTEEFVAVYRMHPLLPDNYRFYSAADDRQIDDCSFLQVSGPYTRVLTERLGMDNLIYSFGHGHPGALCLNNYPRALRDFAKDGESIDIAVVDLLRDRERGIPRYNEFRGLLHLPPITDFGELDVSPEQLQAIERIYKSPDELDLMIGLFAEKRPRGFAFSDTAFRIFILMASRRLKSDRFFTANYGPEDYQPEGIRWVDESDLKSVIHRHHPKLATALQGAEKVFAPWRGQL